MEFSEIGNYKYKDQIGQGHFAKVYLGEHIQTGKRVAIKKIPESKIRETIKISEYNIEITVSQHLNHPNIIKIFEIIQTDDFYYIIMEYAQKGDLFSFIEQNVPSENDIKVIFRQILFGVQFAHKKGICHRDLKLENIFLTDHLTPKLADFGLAGTLQPGYFMRKVCGTLSYFSPEQLKSNFYSGETSDIWACGVILYILLYRQFPFEYQSKGELLKNIIQNNLEFPEKYSNEVKDLVQRMLYPKLHKRICTVKEVLQHNWLLIDHLNSEIDNTFYEEVPMPENYQLNVDIVQEMRKLNILTTQKSLRQCLDMLVQSDNMSDIKISYNILLHSMCNKSRKQINKINIDSYFFQLLNKVDKKQTMNILQQFFIDVKERETKYNQWKFGFEIYLDLKAFLIFLLQLLNKKSLQLELISAPQLLFEIKQQFNQETRYFQLQLSSGNKKCEFFNFQIYLHSK